MEQKLILKSGLVKLRNHKLNMRNMRRTIQIKNIITEVKKLRDEELIEIANIKSKSEEITDLPDKEAISTKENENMKRENNFGIDKNKKPEFEEANEKKKEVDGKYLDICLMKASLFKQILEMRASTMKKGLKTKKFNQYEVTSRKKGTILRRHHYFNFELPNRALH